MPNGVACSTNKSTTQEEAKQGDRGASPRVISDSATTDRRKSSENARFLIIGANCRSLPFNLVITVAYCVEAPHVAVTRNPAYILTKNLFLALNAIWLITMLRTLLRN